MDHTTLKNARNMKSVAQEKIRYFEGFMREMAVKRISFFLEILMLYEV